MHLCLVREVFATQNKSDLLSSIKEPNLEDNFTLTRVLGPKLTT